MEQFLRFDHQQRDGLHTYVLRAGDTDTPPPLWPGLWQLDYPEQAPLNPFLGYGVNNADGEALAVWRALAWAITEGTGRYAIPTYYRDEAARFLGVDRAAIPLVRWEYQVDVELSDPAKADVGFVSARACVPIRPKPDKWERLHHGFAGLFAVHTFAELTAIEHAVCGDASSETTLFGLDPRVTRDEALASTLDQPSRPQLHDVLRPGDIFVDLAVVRDRFLGHTSYLTVKTVQPLDGRLHRLADHYRDAFSRYANSVDDIRTFEDFRAAMDTLLAPPADQTP